MGNLFYAVTMLIAGSCLGLQSIVNSNLSRSTGPFLSGALNGFCVVTLLSLLSVISRNANLSAVASVPKWQLLGGVFAAIALLSTIASVPRIGAYGAAACSAFGQLCITVAADHFGWLGVSVQRIDSWRILGLLLIICGVFCVFKQQIFSSI